MLPEPPEPPEQDFEPFNVNDDLPEGFELDHVDYDYEPDPGDYEVGEAAIDDLTWNDFVFEIDQQKTYEEVVARFTEERLQSYYLRNPTLAEPALASLQHAQALLETEPQAALVFAATSMELTIKAVLLKPIVSGLVHTEGLADLITDLATQHTGMERFRELFSRVLADFGGVDLQTYKRTPTSKTLWQEIDDISKSRNRLVHRGERQKDSLAKLAVAVAGTLLQRLFPVILEKVKLSIRPPMMIVRQG